jgi:hypothetical protein
MVLILKSNQITNNKIANEFLIKTNSHLGLLNSKKIDIGDSLILIFQKTKSDCSSILIINKNPKLVILYKIAQQW